MESVGVEPTPSDFQSDAITVSANFPNSFTASCQPGKRFNVSLPTLLLLKPCKRACSQQTGKEGIEPSNSG